MSDLIGFAILIVLLAMFVQDSLKSRRPTKPKTQDEKFLEAAHVKPWKEDR